MGTDIFCSLFTTNRGKMLSGTAGIICPFMYQLQFPGLTETTVGDSVIGSSKLAPLQCLEHTKERDFFSVSTSLKNPPVKLFEYWCLSLAALTVARLCLACIPHPCPSEAVSIIGRNKL